MKSIGTDFGFLTMATPSDYLKAIGLALSLRVSNPGVPIAIACSKKVANLVRPYFDVVVEEKAGIRGFMHKVYLDEYSPFKETVFFDSDILVFKEVKPYIRQWGTAPYYACGTYYSDGKSDFGLDRLAIMARLDKPKMVEIGGAGHAYFRKPDCGVVFDMAREIAADYPSWAGNIPFADEDAINIVMTKLDMQPAPHADFFSRYLTAQPGTMKMDATAGKCTFRLAENNTLYSPCMMHFAANEAPIPYTWQLFKLFRKFNVPTNGLFSMGLKDFYERNIKLQISIYKNRLKRALA